MREPVYQYEIYELYTVEVAGIIDSQALLGWRLHSCFPTGKEVVHQEYGCRVMLIFERLKEDGK